VTADQVRDPDSGQPGLAVRFRDGHGNVLHREHRLAGRLLWMGQEVLRRADTIEVAGRLRARAGGEHRVGVAGVGWFRLTAGDAFQHWSTDRRAWDTEPGPYQLRVGRSAADLPLTAAITVR
jgi:hypothetical protein